MAEPFSTAAAALGVADVIIRTGKYVRKVSKDTNHIDREIEALEFEIDKFDRVYSALSDLCAESTRKSAGQAHTDADKASHALWHRATTLIKEGRDLVEKLEGLLKSILGDERSPRFQKVDDLRKAIRLSKKDGQYDQIRTRFHLINMELNTMLDAVQWASNEAFHSQVNRSLEQLPERVAQEMQTLFAQLKLGEETKDLVGPEKTANGSASMNKHFYVQKSDVSEWTGRERDLARLRDAILRGATAEKIFQKRFVIHGIAGAGKTQFCCKFAQDYRQDFWGIFWVDASSPQNAVESWKKIAKIGGREANEEAGKHWLSNQESPWLLVIDNADASEDAIGKHFPAGDRGHVLITTRNPRLKACATVGHIPLDKLEEDEADDLLRKTSQHTPWNETAKSYAATIARYLGYLPLALVHAGRAICHRFCSLSTYIPYVNRILEGYRKRNMIFHTDDEYDNIEDEYGEGPFMSFEIIYDGLDAQAKKNTAKALRYNDATELLNMFAFFHNNDIRVEMLVKTGRNIRWAAQSSGRQIEEKDKEPDAPPKPYLKQFKAWLIATGMKMQQLKPVLPSILREADKKDLDEARMGRAIDVLVRMSLISESSEEGSYSMHPLVHLWVRKRLETSAAQAYWCETANNVLAGSVKIPPMPDEPGDQDYYLRIIPHVNNIQMMKMDVKDQLRCNRQQEGALRRLFPLRRPPAISTLEARNTAKYGRVYLQCARFKEAKELLQTVLDFVIANLGPDNPFCAILQMPLSVSCWHLGQTEEAEKLQEKALQLCRTEFGNYHSQTLKITDELGRTMWQRGKLTGAKLLHQMAITGMEGRPSLLRERMNAKNHLGGIQVWYWQLDAAIEIYKEASETLRAHFGEDDTDYLDATNGLAMAYYLKGNITDVQRAVDLLEDVYRRRELKLGHENIYTLLSACCLARSLVSLGALTEDRVAIGRAKAIFEDGLEIAERNLGPLHFGTLMGRQCQVEVLVVEKHYDEAEREYKALAEIEKGTVGLERDLLWTYNMLAKCYEIQGRYEDAVQTLDLFLDHIDAMGGQRHPWRRMTCGRQEDLKRRIELAKEDPLATPTIPASSTVDLLAS